MTERKSVIAKVAKIEMRRHTLVGAMLLRNGDVDGPLCGMSRTTADPCRQS